MQDTERAVGDQAVDRVVTGPGDKGRYHRNWLDGEQVWIV